VFILTRKKKQKRCRKEKNIVKSKINFTKITTKQMVTMSVIIAVAMILSYVESLIPVFIPIPGVKLGLSNIATVFALFSLGAPAAVMVSIIRVLLSCLLFGNVSTLIYSLFGAALSLLFMFLARRFNLFSTVGVSVIGGVFHNVGQIIAAIIMIENVGLAYYLPPLILSGVVTGALIGFIAGILIEKMKKSKIIS
jgi:heptaprenyl diphosphate synthase